MNTAGKKLLAWAVAGAVVFGAVRAFAGWSNPWAVSTLQAPAAAVLAVPSPSASAVHIPGCIERGCVK